jgi:hypothetical protein
LPSIVPEELQNTRFVPDDERSNHLGYEGSWYFRGQHNWVDLKEIRFLDAARDTVAAEYDLVIHLPVSAADSEPLVLTVPTKVEPDKGEFVPKPPRHVLAIGTFAETSEDFWECESTYHGCPVKIQLHAEPDSFERIATFAKSVIVENAITPTCIRQHVEELIGTLQWKFDAFKVRTPFRAEELVANWFSFYRDDDSDELTLSIGLCDPTDSGKWFLRFHGTEAWHLEWVPN